MDLGGPDFPPLHQHRYADLGKIHFEVVLLTKHLVSGALVVYYEARTVMVNDDRYLTMSGNLTIVVIVCTLVVNLLTTSLIAGRLW